jgi:hypothetical protein
LFNLLWLWTQCNERNICGEMMKLVLIALLLVSLLLISGCSTNESKDNFAKCFTESGATFYGAYWCSHCADQKKIIGPSMKHIKYVECSLPNRAGQTEACKEANIQTYPTWEFGDKSRATGIYTLEQLAQKSGCNLEK